MKLVVAAVRPTPILWLRASGLESPTEVPASTLPARGIAPVRPNIASRSVVLPLWKGPTSAMHRGPRGLLTSSPIAASFIWSSALDWVGGLMLPLPPRFGKSELAAASRKKDLHLSHVLHGRETTTAHAADRRSRGQAPSPTPPPGVAGTRQGSPSRPKVQA